MVIYGSFMQIAKFWFSFLQSTEIFFLTLRLLNFILYLDSGSKWLKEVFTMKTTGMIRQLDSLGRIVLPIELRRTLDISAKDMLEILVDGNTVLLRKYEPNCHFCGSNHGLVSYKDKMICKHCLKDLKEL